MNIYNNGNKHLLRSKGILIAVLGTFLLFSCITDTTFDHHGDDYTYVAPPKPPIRWIIREDVRKDCEPNKLEGIEIVDEIPTGEKFTSQEILLLTEYLRTIFIENNMYCTRRFEEYTHSILFEGNKYDIANYKFTIDGREVNIQIDDADTRQDEKHYAISDYLAYDKDRLLVSRNKYSPVGNWIIIMPLSNHEISNEKIAGIINWTDYNSDDILDAAVIRIRHPGTLFHEMHHFFVTSAEDYVSIPPSSDDTQFP
jgi:hypothetical protein